MAKVKLAAYWRGRFAELNRRFALLQQRSLLEMDTVESELQEQRRVNTLLQSDQRELKTRLALAEEQLQKERNRSVQALEIAENATIGVTAISRLVHGSSSILETLERTVQQLDKER